MALLSLIKKKNTNPTQEFDLRKRFNPVETLVTISLFLCGIISIAATIAIIIILFSQTRLFFQISKMSLIDFLTGTKWQPAIGEFGILPLLSATLVTTTIAMSVAMPLGICVAIYLSEYASEKSRKILKPILEVLAGIPTVVYGFFALAFITPILRNIFGRDVVNIYNTASAGIAMGILILPLVATMTEDALNAVPRSLREAGYGLGATKLEVAIKIVVPASISGIAAAILIGLSRAIGETMIVAIAAGSGSKLTANPFLSAETMTGYIVRISGGDLSYDTLDYDSIYSLAFVLFFFTLGLNLLSQRIVRGHREKYE